MQALQFFAAEDWSIIGRFHRGEKQAFDDLVRKHRKHANAFAFHLTKNRDEAEDVVSETFIRIYRSLCQFNGHSSFTTWMYRIERNCFLDMRKRASVRSSINVDVRDSGIESQISRQTADRYEDAQAGLERRERLLMIDSAIRRLPDSQRRTLMMYQAECMSYEEIAAGLVLPIGTVKSRINRARARLAKTASEYLKS